MMFKCCIGVLPSPVSALFQYNSVIHTHNTRRSKFIHTPIGRSEATYRTFSYRGAHIWNYISQNVPTDVSYACFKDSRFKIQKTFIRHKSISYCI